MENGTMVSKIMYKDVSVLDYCEQHGLDTRYVKNLLSPRMKPSVEEVISKAFIRKNNNAYLNISNKLKYKLKMRYRSLTTKNLVGGKWLNGIYNEDNICIKRGIDVFMEDIVKYLRENDIDEQFMLDNHKLRLYKKIKTKPFDRDNYTFYHNDIGRITTNTYILDGKYTLKEYCKKHNLVLHRIISRINNLGWSLESALDSTLYKERDSKYYYKGMPLVEACFKYDIIYQTALRKIKHKKCTVEEAVNELIATRNKRKKNNLDEGTLHKYCIDNNISYQLILYRSKIKNQSHEQTIAEYHEDPIAFTNYCYKYIYKDQPLVVYCNKANLNYAHIVHLITKKQCTVEEAVEEIIKKKEEKLRLLRRKRILKNIQASTT